MDVVLYAAVAQNGVIGAQGDMPWRLSTDMQRFKAGTMGKPVVMGRKTWESFPRRPLPGRLNIVITRSPEFVAEGAEVVGSFEEALERARAAGAEEAAIIGGGEIYRQAMPVVDRLNITQIEANIEGDTRFPEIDPTVWEIVESASYPAGPKDDYPTRYSVYTRRTGAKSAN